MKNRIVAILFLCAIVLENATLAEAPKKGRVMCEGDNCRALNVPTGSTVGGAWGLIQDFKSRVRNRVEGADKSKSENSPPPAPKISAVKKRKQVPKVQTSLAAASPPYQMDADTNLPHYYAGIDRHDVESSDKVVFVPKSNDPKLKGIRSGDIIWAVVEQEIKASPELPTPIRAIAISGSLKGSYFVGEAKLDRELKRILFNFSKLRIRNGDLVYSIKAAGLSPRGSIGLEGEYVSHTGKFFIAELASAAAAGFVDSTINRNQTALGTYVQEPSLATSGKSAAVAALSKTTERMADSVKTAPEYTQIQGYQEIQVMIQDDPVEAN